MEEINSGMINTRKLQSMVKSARESNESTFIIYVSDKNLELMMYEDEEALNEPLSAYQYSSFISALKRYTGNHDTAYPSQLNWLTITSFFEDINICPVRYSLFIDMSEFFEKI